MRRLRLRLRRPRSRLRQSRSCMFDARVRLPRHADLRSRRLHGTTTTLVDRVSIHSYSRAPSIFHLLQVLLEHFRRAGERPNAREAELNNFSKISTFYAKLITFTFLGALPTIMDFGKESWWNGRAASSQLADQNSPIQDWRARPQKQGKNVEKVPFST